MALRFDIGKNRVCVLQIWKFVFSFIQAHKPYFDLAHALSAVLNVLAWCLAFLLLTWQWRRVRRVSLGPFSFWMAQKQEAVDAAVTAARAWKAQASEQQVDVPRIQATVERAFAPEANSVLRGKSVLWVDDNPANNELAVRALKKISSGCRAGHEHRSGIGRN